MAAAASVFEPSAGDDLTPYLYIDGVRLDAVHQARIQSSRRHRNELRLKRMVDILVSSVLILLVAPMLLICYIAIKLTSQGPFIFSQPRWGRDEQKFRCFKMRTMYVAGDPRGPKEAIPFANGGSLVKMKRDPRVTPPGRWLRRTSIDELPQLFNVLRGDMSFVGPRPLVLPMLDDFHHARAARCVVRPGITGLWQIRNRGNNTHISQMIADDTEYIRELSLLLDLRILVATPREVLKGTGAM